MAQNPNQQNPNQQQQAPGGFSTFSQMQKAGVARPPSPSYATQPQSAGAQMYGKPSNPTGFNPQQKPTIQNPLAATTGQGMPPQQQHPIAQETPHQQPQSMATTMGPGTPGGMGFHGGPGEGSPGSRFDPLTQGASQTYRPPQMTNGQGLIPYTGSQQIETVANMGQPTQHPPVTTPGGPGTQPQVPEAGQPAQNQNWGNTGNQLYQNWQQSQQQIGQNPFQYNNPINQQIGQSVSQNLVNPSAYNSQMALQTYRDTSQQMGQDFDYQRQQLQNMMAKRGLDNSTIHGQQYSDLGTEQARAQANLVHGLTSDAAHQYSTDWANALNGAMGWGAQDYGQAQGTYGTNQQAQQQQYNQNQQNFQNYVGFGQQDFNNQMDVNQFNANRDDAMNQYLLALMGVSVANVLEAIMKGIQGGAGAYQENRRYKQEQADKDEQMAFERRFRENQFKEQLRGEKANRDYQATSLAMQAKAGERAAASDEANRAERRSEFEGQQHDRDISQLLEQNKMEGFISSNPEAEIAARKFGGTVRPIHEVMESARTQANITRRNVDIPGQGTAIYGYNPNDSNRSSMYNAQSDELQGYINGMAVRGEQAANAILHQYKADDPIFPLDEQTRATVNAHAQAAAQEARDRYADVVWNAKQIDLNGKHKGGQNTAPPPAGPQIDPRYQRLMGGDLAPSDGSAAPSPSSVHGIDLSKVFKPKVQ